MTVGSLRNRPTVPRMPIVAIGVLIFMPSPVWATCPATNAKVPSTRLKSAPFEALLGLEIVFVERHPRVVHEVKRGAVREGDAAGGIGAGLDDVGLVDRIADMQRAGDAVMDERDLADDLLDLADRFRRQGRLRLRVLPGRRRAGQQVDQVAGQMRAVRRHQVGVLFGGEVAGDDETVTVLPGQDQIGTRARKVPAEQKLRIGNIDSVGMRCIHMISGHTNAVASLRRGPVNHFALPPRPHPSAND